VAQWLARWISNRHEFNSRPVCYQIIVKSMLMFFKQTTAAVDKRQLVYSQNGEVALSYTASGFQYELT